MIPIETLLSDLETNLDYLLKSKVENTPLAAQGDYSFKFIPDGGEYETYYRRDGSNQIHYNILGIGEIVESAITPIGALQVATQTLSMTIALRLEKEKGIKDEDLFLPVRNAIADYAATAHVLTITNEGKSFNVSYTLTQPYAGDIAIRPEIGRSIVYTFSVYYSFIQNGINSKSITLTIDGETVYTEDLTIVRVPVQDGAAFTGTNGTAKNINTQTALEITFTTPTISGSKFSQELYDYILNGGDKMFTVSVSNPTTAGSFPSKYTYTMIFGQCNITGRGVENAGYNVTLVEGIDL